MIKNQSKEDYLEAILLLSDEQEDVHQIDVARRMKVSQPAVQKALRTLIAEDLIMMDGLHLYLTEKGKQYAQGVYERHVTLRNFLLSLGVDAQTADDDACVLEHAISDVTYQAIKAKMGK